MYGTNRSNKIETLWENARQNGKWIPASTGSQLKASVLFDEILSHSPDMQKAGELAGACGLEILEINDKQGGFYVIREKKDHRTGQGFYVVRTGKAFPILSEAPHCGSDKYTGTINMNFFLYHRIKAAAFNTLPRTDIDLAHETRSYFQVFTETFARCFPNEGIIIQWHGFDPSKRKNPSATLSDFIISSGTTRPSLHAQNLQARIKTGFGASVLLYDEKNRVLGAETNEQAIALMNMKFNGFIHMEISPQWREKLRNKTKLSADFFYCIIGECK